LDFVAQIGQLIFVANDVADFPEIESEELLELADAAQPSDILLAVAPGPTS
jgi:hypothetical protein